MAVTPAPPRQRRRSIEERSAGGLVLDRRSLDAAGALIARVDRRGRLLWSLPKGHVEPGESAQAAAVREIAEETGIQGTVIGELGTIDFWFVADGRRVHKTVHHYLLVRDSGELSDADIEVSQVAWVPLTEAAERLAYDDERGLLRHIPTLLSGPA